MDRSVPLPVRRRPSVSVWTQIDPGRGGSGAACGSAQLPRLGKPPSTALVTLSVCVNETSISDGQQQSGEAEARPRHLPTVCHHATAVQRGGRDSGTRGDLARSGLCLLVDSGMEQLSPWPSCGRELLSSRKRHDIPAALGGSDKWLFLPTPEPRGTPAPGSPSPHLGPCQRPRQSRLPRHASSPWEPHCSVR